MKNLLYNRNNIILCSVILLFGLLYISICFSNHYFFRTFWADFGIYNNAFYDFAHFRVNRNPLFEPPLDNFFQVHMSFTLVVLVPFYWLFGWLFGTYTLLFLQVVFILLGGYGVYLFIKLKSNNFWLGILAMFHYFILWGHYSCLAADYIDTTVAASIVPLFLFFFEKRKFLYATIWFVFVIIAKENMPLWLIFISLFLIVIHRKEAFRPHIHAFPYIRKSDYIILLLDHSTYPLSKKQFDSEKNKYLAEKNWKTIVDDYPLLIL